MNPDFQEAIEMTRSGDKVGAQKKVAALLKEDPDNAHGWYLLSLLVDSDQKTCGLFKQSRFPRSQS